MSDSPVYLEEESFYPAYYVMALLGAIGFAAFPWLAPTDDVDMRPWLAIFGMFFLLLCLNAFWLRVDVYPDRVRARLGRVIPVWWKTISINEIESMEVVDLGWHRWNGGAHFVRYKGKTTLMMLSGAPRAVCIERKRGHRVVISSEQPELLAETIERARDR